MLLSASIIIPTYNRLNYLKMCLEALRNQQIGDFEVVVVDDGSTDLTPVYLSDLAAIWPRLSWQRHPQNQGRATARNTGLDIAQAPLIIFLDCDVMVQPDFIKAHLEFHHTYGTGWIGQGPIILTHNEQEPTKTAFSPWTDASRAFFATGNVSVARQAVLEVGGFDTDFSVYGWEDLELGIRLRKHGLRTKPVSHAPGFHLEPPFNLEHWSELQTKERARAAGAWLFFKKHPSLEVRMMTQLTPLHRLADTLIRKLLLGKNTTEFYLAQIEQQCSEKKRLAISRLLLNHDYLLTLNQIQQTERKHGKSITNETP